MSKASFEGAAPPWGRWSGGTMTGGTQGIADLSLLAGVGLMGGAMFRAVLDSDLVVKPGDQITLAPQPGRIRWFDPETTKAVA